MLKAVIVDVDGTLYALDRVRRQMAGRLMRFAAFHPFRGWKTIRALKAFREAQERMRSLGTAWGQVEKAATMCDYPGEFVRACAARWMDREPLPWVAEARYPGVAEFFAWAKRRALPVGVVSDYDPREKLRALGLDADVAVWAQQEEVGAFKPDPRGLIVAARRLGVAPAEAVYIGDREEVDGAAASAAGMPVLILGAGRDWRGITAHLEAAIGREEKATASV
jgi:FMN phosphatase YigB (HAD superfamily)